jgi:hypothetical protein
MLENIAFWIKNESDWYGGESHAHLISMIFIMLTTLYFLFYFMVSKYFRKKGIIRNSEIEEIAFKKKIISADQLMIKYSANLNASSTMAALSVTMVLLSVAALFQIDLEPYNNFIAVMVCGMMTVASVSLLFAHELYDAIINPVFSPSKKFRLRKLGSNFQALGLCMFIFSMLLAISTVSTSATILNSFASCTIMTMYFEIRLVDTERKEEELEEILNIYKK